MNILLEAPGYTWLFFPGGPGLGSEYLLELCNTIKLPGSIYLIDFPKDGTNSEGQLSIPFWEEGFLNLLKQFERPIVVAHSFSGMFSLNLPEIEDLLGGLVLMNTAIENTFFPHISAMQQKHKLPDLVPAASEYHLNPTDQSYKLFWDTYKHYCFTHEELTKGENLMELFAFNNDAYYESVEHFYANYGCKWHPTKIPVLTIASELDYICPPDVFLHNDSFQSEWVLNKLIPNAGHCPWINHMKTIQQCFDEFVALKKIHTQ